MGHLFSMHLKIHNSLDGGIGHGHWFGDECHQIAFIYVVYVFFIGAILIHIRLWHCKVWWTCLMTYAMRFKDKLHFAISVLEYFVKVTPGQCCTALQGKFDIKLAPMGSSLIIVNDGSLVIEMYGAWFKSYQKSQTLSRWSRSGCFSLKASFFFFEWYGLSNLPKKLASHGLGAVWLS